MALASGCGAGPTVAVHANVLTGVQQGCSRGTTEGNQRVFRNFNLIECRNIYEMIRLFLILALACQSLASGDTAQVASPAELVSTLQQESVTTIVLTHNIWLCDEHWPSTGPIWLARNVTITAQLPSTLLHVCFEGKKKGVLGLKPHTTLTFKKLVVKAVSKSGASSIDGRSFRCNLRADGRRALQEDAQPCSALAVPPLLSCPQPCSLT